jgi:hypothetical protein
MKNTNNKPTIYFDLDGTVYPLYQQDEWLPRITVDLDPTAYAADDTLVPADTLMDTLTALVEAGYSIGVISWLANGIPAEYPVVAADPAYAKAVRATKRAWVRKYMPQATEVHIVKYGTPKHSVVRNAGILVDDNAGVRAKWNRGATIDATQNMIADLQALVNTPQ